MRSFVALGPLADLYLSGIFFQHNPNWDKWIVVNNFCKICWIFLGCIYFARSQWIFSSFFPHCDISGLWCCVNTQGIISCNTLSNCDHSFVRIGLILAYFTLFDFATTLSPFRKRSKISFIKQVPCKSGDRCTFLYKMHLKQKYDREHFNFFNCKWKETKK